MHVAELFGEVARTLARHESLDATLDQIVHLAVESIHGCEFAGISLLRGRTVAPSATTGDVPRTIDLIQTEAQQGPCVDAIREHDLVHVRDLGSEERWPEFSPRAHAETGISSILSVRLFVEEDTMGALELYACKADAFDDVDVALASVFAAHAAVAMASARLEANLARKAETRDLIGQAKGMLMANTDLDDAAAFQVLRRASQRLNRKLVDVADDVVHRRSLEEGS